MAVVRPAADLLATDHVFDEHNASMETQRQLVKQLYVLQEIVVGVATNIDINSRVMCRSDVYSSQQVGIVSSAAEHHNVLSVLVIIPNYCKTRNYRVPFILRIMQPQQICEYNVWQIFNIQKVILYY